MRIIGIILWLIGVIYAIGWGIKIRHTAKNEQATESIFEVHVFLLAVSVILIPIFSLSPFHLLWMFLASFLLPFLSLYFPFRLLWPVASLYCSLWYIGIRNPGRAYYLSGDYAKAIESFKETIQVKPNSAETYFYLGLAYGKLGDHQKELESYKEAVRLKPDFAEVHFNLGFLYKDLGDSQQAMESFRDALLFKPDYIKARCHIAVLYAEMGDRENALQEYELVKKLDKNSAEELYLLINTKNKNSEECVKKTEGIAK